METSHNSVDRSFHSGNSVAYCGCASKSSIHVTAQCDSQSKLHVSACLRRITAVCQMSLPSLYRHLAQVLTQASLHLPPSITIAEEYPKGPHSRSQSHPQACRLRPRVLAALYSHARLQNGQRCSCWEVSHLVMHCRWNAWAHTPHTTGLSSPGNLPSGGQPSKGILQMPQTSSPASQVHSATACQLLIWTWKALLALGGVSGSGLAPAAAAAAAVPPLERLPGGIGLDRVG